MALLLFLTSCVIFANLNSAESTSGTQQQITSLINGLFRRASDITRNLPATFGTHDTELDCYWTVHESLQKYLHNQAHTQSKITQEIESVYVDSPMTLTIRSIQNHAGPFMYLFLSCPGVITDVQKLQELLQEESNSNVRSIWTLEYYTGSLKLKNLENSEDFSVSEPTELFSAMMSRQKSQFKPGKWTAKSTEIKSCKDSDDRKAIDVIEFPLIDSSRRKVYLVCEECSKFVGIQAAVASAHSLIAMEVTFAFRPQNRLFYKIKRSLQKSKLGKPLSERKDKALKKWIKSKPKMKLMNHCERLVSGSLIHSRPETYALSWVFTESNAGIVYVENHPSPPQQIRFTTKRVFPNSLIQWKFFDSRISFELRVTPKAEIVGILINHQILAPIDTTNDDLEDNVEKKQMDIRRHA